MSWLIKNLQPTRERKKKACCWSFKTGLTEPDLFCKIWDAETSWDPKLCFSVIHLLPAISLTDYLLHIRGTGTDWNQINSVWKISIHDLDLPPITRHLSSAVLKTANIWWGRSIIKHYKWLARTSHWWQLSHRCGQRRDHWANCSSPSTQSHRISTMESATMCSASTHCSWKDLMLLCKKYIFSMIWSLLHKLHWPPLCTISVFVNVITFGVLASSVCIVIESQQDKALPHIALKKTTTTKKNYCYEFNVTDLIFRKKI